MVLTCLFSTICNGKRKYHEAMTLIISFRTQSHSACHTLLMLAWFFKINWLLHSVTHIKILVFFKIVHLMFMVKKQDPPLYQKKKKKAKSTFDHPKIVYTRVTIIFLFNVRFKFNIHQIHFLRHI